ncbi:NAD(+) synthetase, partial [candidate division WOR-3 bacterium]|nr:NAD(+) synthetase [candidate division WOR-3 bacterium]
IPKEIVEKAPSADLWEGQSDEKEMGISYQIIDEFSYMFFDKKENIETIIKSGINKEYCDKIINTYNRNNFKRIGPTILQLNV